MAQLTRAQLLIEIEQLRVERQQLITERDEAVEALHRLHSEVLTFKLTAASEGKAITTRAVPEGKVLVNGRMLPAHMAAAREAAMRMNRVVKIGA